MLQKAVHKKPVELGWINRSKMLTAIKLWPTGIYHLPEQTPDAKEKFSTGVHIKNLVKKIMFDA